MMIDAYFLTFHRTSSFWRKPESKQRTCLEPLLEATLVKMFLAWIPAYAGMTK